MSVAKITKSAVDRMGPWTVLWDTEIKGFGCRRHGTDGRHYLLRYRFNGKQTFRKIGRAGSPWTPDTARQEALKLLGQIVSGVNPSLQASVGTTFGAEAQRYLVGRERDARRETLKHLRLHLLKHSLILHPLALDAIDRRQIAQLLARVESGSGAVSRNRVRSSLSAFFGWCVREGLLDANPVTGTGKADEGGSRDRVLSEAELGEVWRKGNDAVRLLILTGCRREEIGLMRWSEIDFERSLLVLPPARTKNGQKHELPLSPLALEILRNRQGNSSGPLVSANDGWVFERGSWSHVKEMLDRSLVGVASWRIHDLRRTTATGMAELGVLLHIIEAVLNHVSGHKGGVAGIYNRARYEAEMRDALARWAAHVVKITSA